MASTPAGIPSVNSKAKALVEEFLEEKRREAPLQGSASRAEQGRTITVAVLALICAAAWLAPYPTTSEIEPVDPVFEAASARLTVFLAATKVKEYYARHARLPASLKEAGISEPAIDYGPGTDSSFTLETISTGQRIVFDSHKELHMVLGGSVSIIEKKGK
jgi:hypothetical protein